MVAVNFDSCMWGGKRAKATRLLVSSHDLDDMELACDNSHPHAPWGVTALGHFATAEEAEYPLPLSRKYVANVKQRIQPERLEWTVKQFRLDTLACASSQTSAHPQLISDFHHMLWTNNPGSITSPWTVLPSPPAPATGGETTEQATEHLQYVGVFKTPQQHYEEAMTLNHPIESSSGVPSELGRAVTFVLSRSPAQVAKFRIDMLKDCIEASTRLRQKEADTRSGMDSKVNEVTRTKRIEVFRSLLEDISFVDMEVINILVDGVKLTGWEPDSDLYAKRYNPPTMTVESLNSQALWRRKLMLGKSMSSEERSLAPTLWDETMKEVEAGFLEGPLEELQVSQLLQCDDWTASRRFLLLQGEEQKPRVIDDLKASGVNAAFGSTSYLNLQDADFLSCFLLFLSKSLTTRKVVTTRSILNDINSDWAADPGFHGRGVDLSKAYKQVSLHPDARKHAVIAVRKEDATWHFFLSRSMPFGASASVFAFNKLSKAIWHLLVQRFNMLCSVFFDDYPVVEHSTLTHITTGVLDVFLNLLGWGHATTGKKAVPFASEMTVLGVTFDLSALHVGRLKIFNKRGRLERIIALLQSIKDEGRIGVDSPSVLQGLLNFAGRFVLGRALRRPMHVLSTSAQWRDNPLEVRKFCDRTTACLQASSPGAFQCWPTLCQ